MATARPTKQNQPGQHAQSERSAGSTLKHPLYKHIQVTTAAAAADGIHTESSIRSMLALAYVLAPDSNTRHTPAVLAVLKRCNAATYIYSTLCIQLCCCCHLLPNGQHRQTHLFRCKLQHCCERSILRHAEAAPLRNLC